MMRSHSLALRKSSRVYNSALSVSTRRRLGGLRRNSGGMLTAPPSRELPRGRTLSKATRMARSEKPSLRRSTTALDMSQPRRISRCRRASWRASTSFSWFTLRSPEEHRPVAQCAKPLGDDDLVAGDHRFAAVHGRLVGRAVAAEVLPEQRHAELGLKGMADLGEARAAAFHAFVEIHHEAPGAVAARAAVAQVFAGTGLEPVPVRLELLADVVALRLDTFGIFRANAQCLADLLIDAHCHRTAQV